MTIEVGDIKMSDLPRNIARSQKRQMSPKSETTWLGSPLDLSSPANYPRDLFKDRSREK